MPDYSKGKIYAIRSHQTDKIYIGSTTQSLSVRIGGHRDNYKRYLKAKAKSYTSSYEILKYEDYYIELLELCPCNSIEELMHREGELIRLNNCVNKNIPVLNKKPYVEIQKNIIKNLDTTDIIINITVKGYTINQLIELLGDNLMIDPKV